MAFVNEYVPPLAQETSEFLRDARMKLRTGGSRFDMWTVDRTNDMVLQLQRTGHSMETRHDEYWSFVDRKGYYHWVATVLSNTEVAPDVLAIVRSIAFQKGGKLSDPDEQTRAWIKAALYEYRDVGAASKYGNVQLTLIDAFSGQEI